MNNAPFSLKTTFHPKDAREDKIDLDVGAWEVHDIGPNAEDEYEFKNYLGSPPSGSEDAAWAKPGELALHGWFFLRPAGKGKDRNKLLIRRQSLKHPINDHRHEAPLCGGHCLFYRDRKARVIGGGGTVHCAKLRLSLNLQRFIRHQPPNDNPSKPVHFLSIRQRRGSHFFHGEECSLDGEDNWIPQTPAWRQFEATMSFEDHLEAVLKVVDANFKRACEVVNGLELDQNREVLAGRSGEHYSLSKVETFWEFPSVDPCGDVFSIGAKLMHLKKEEGEATHYPFQEKKTGRVRNSPCFKIPISEGVTLTVYAKTNQRIRFEVVHRNLMSQRTDLLREAGVPFAGGQSLVGRVASDPWGIAEESSEPLEPNNEGTAGGQGWQSEYVFTR